MVAIIKKIKLGGFSEWYCFLQAFKKAGIFIDDFATSMGYKLDEQEMGEETDVELVILSPADLGFKRPPRSKTGLYRRALKSGLAICSPEVGPQLRLQYRDQQQDEALFIGMKPITIMRGFRPFVFMVWHGERPIRGSVSGNGLWLIALPGQLDLDAPWVFMRRKL